MARRQIRFIRMVSTHSRPKAAALARAGIDKDKAFQHTAARRRLQGYQVLHVVCALFQHTAARRRLHDIINNIITILGVSTHSRPKAAA